MAIYPWFLFILPLVPFTEGYKILVVAPMATSSHAILGDGLVRHLLNAGHEITYATPNLKNTTNPKLHYVDLTKNLKLVPDNFFNLERHLQNSSDRPTVLHILDMLRKVGSFTLTNPNLQKVLTDHSQEFDLVIPVHVSVGSEFYGLSVLYDCPLIWLSTIEPHSGILSEIDEAKSTAYVPTAISSNVAPFTFKQRVTELVIHTVLSLIQMFYIEPYQKEQYAKIFEPLLKSKGKTLPPYEDVVYNASLILGHAHPALGSSMTLPQNYIQIAGYYIDEDVKPLPEDLQTILDDAKDGVIYFSLGSILKSKDLPQIIKDGLLKVFSGMKQTVLWKFEEVMPNLPKNVHILKWAPQQSILAHPNCVLFITHGGGLSTTETVHFGKPIIGIPVFGDQFNNMMRAENKGFAVKVDLSYSLAEDLKAAIAEVLSTDKYSNRAKGLSLIHI